MGERELWNPASSTALLHDALPAKLLQRRLPFPVGDAQALLGRIDVMLQEGKERREGALVARQRELLALVVDAHADRPAPGVVGQREEDVVLPAVADEEASQRSVPQHAMGVLHSQRTPVEAAALELGRCVGDDVAVLLAGEGGEVGQIRAADDHRSRVGIWSGAVLELLRLCALRSEGELLPGQR